MWRQMCKIGFNVVLRHIKSSKKGVPWTQTYSFWRMPVYLSGWFSFALSPCGLRVLSSIIQKSSLVSNISLRSNLVLLHTLSCSIKVKVACSLKLCPGNRKCWSISIDVATLQSSLCLLIRMLAGGSDLPTYWITGHNLHSIRYSTHILLQLRVWNIR